MSWKIFRIIFAGLAVAFMIAGIVHCAQGDETTCIAECAMSVALCSAAMATYGKRKMACPARC